MYICFVLQHQLAERMNQRKKEIKIVSVRYVCVVCMKHIHRCSIKSIIPNVVFVLSRSLYLVSLCHYVDIIYVIVHEYIYSLFIFLVYLHSLSHQKSSIQRATNACREKKRNLEMQSRLAFNILFNEHRCLVYGIK